MIGSELSAKSDAGLGNVEGCGKQGREQAGHMVTWSHDGAPVGHVRRGGQAPLLVVGSVPADRLAVLLAKH